MYDVLIVGAGVSGAATARELSKYNLKVLVLEKGSDLASGTSKANSAIVHAGYDCVPGTLMAKLNVEGNKFIHESVKDLDIPFKNIGSLVVCLSESDRANLMELYDRGIKNGVEGMRIIERDELIKMEKNISDNAVCALYAPSAGTICPFTLNIAMAENACDNGVEFIFNEEVTEIIKENDNKNVDLKNDGAEFFIIKTKSGNIYESKIVINAAGVCADTIHNMVSKNKMRIIPRKGEYLLLDREVGDHVSHVIFALPTKMGKGVLISPTAHGNLIVGPTALDLDVNDKDATHTTEDGINHLNNLDMITTVKNVPLKKVITSFAGLRAHEEGHEFIIKEVEDVEGFIDVAGIESPGLTSCMAIGKMASEIAINILSGNQDGAKNNGGKVNNKIEKKKNWNGKRKGIIKISELPIDEANKLIKENNLYGNIVCRCEKVTEGEIVDSINRTLGARDIDGIKRRCRQGMGRCQAGFCTPMTMKILARELSKIYNRQVSLDEITKRGGNSYYVSGNLKEGL